LQRLLATVGKPATVSLRRIPLSRSVLTTVSEYHAGKSEIFLKSLILRLA
jgi:hypothetical protein